MRLSLAPQTASPLRAAHSRWRGMAVTTLPTHLKGNGKEIAIRTGLRFVNKSWRNIVSLIESIVGPAPAEVLVYCWRGGMRSGSVATLLATLGYVLLVLAWPIVSVPSRACTHTRTHAHAHARTHTRTHARAHTHTRWACRVVWLSSVLRLRPPSPV